ncbi:hypothetical protein OK074_4438 [Actinobacteria bacterium OK074]|nr:hypothetical protein OK074_4438 [Actinobacteria bacterium OK074]
MRPYTDPDHDHAPHPAGSVSANGSAASSDYPRHVTAAAGGSTPVRAGLRLPGLERRTLGPVQVFAQSVSATAPAAAMATTPAITAGTAGGGVVWSFVAATALALLIGACVGQFTRRMAAAGSLYSLAAKGLGPGAAFACGYALLIGYGLLVSASLTGCAQYVLELLARIGLSVPTAAGGALIVVTLATAVAACTIRGVRLAARVVLLVEGISITLMAVVFGLLASGGGVEWPAALNGGPTGVTPGAVAAGVLPAFAAFIGFESAASLGVEARRPFHTVPRAVRWTAALAGVMYVGAAAVQVAGFAGGGAVGQLAHGSGTLAGQTDPLTVLATADRLSWVPPLLDAGLAASFLACALATANALTRVLFSMGTEGVAPRALRRTHGAYRTPHMAVAFALPAVTVPPVALLAAGVPVRRCLELLVQTATVGYLVAYLLVCLAVPFFLRGIGELTRAAVAGPALAVPVLAAALIAFTTSTMAARLALPLAVLLTTGTCWYALLRLRRPGALAGIGVYDETSLADVLGGHPDTPRPGR